MRTVWLHSILFLQVKSIESSLDDSTKKVVVFGRLLSSKGSVFEILRQSVYQTRVFAYSDGYCRLYLLEIEGESVIFL